MAKYSKFDIQDVIDSADIRRFIPGASESKPTSYVTCPKCGKEGKGKGLCVTHSRGKNLAKCFSCGFSLTNAVKAVEEYQNLKFPASLEYVAKEIGKVLEPEDAREKRKLSATKMNCESHSVNHNLNLQDSPLKT